MTKTTIDIILQIVDDCEINYRVTSWEDYAVKLKHIKLAMKASGQEYYVFLIRKSKGNRIKKGGICHKAYKKRQKKPKKVENERKTAGILSPIPHRL